MGCLVVCVQQHTNGSQSGEAGRGWQWRGREAGLLRDMLRALHVHCLQHMAQGWTYLERTACQIRTYAADRVLDG